MLFTKNRKIGLVQSLAAAFKRVNILPTSTLATAKSQDTFLGASSLPALGADTAWHTPIVREHIAKTELQIEETGSKTSRTLKGYNLCLVSLFCRPYSSLSQGKTQSQQEPKDTRPSPTIYLGLKTPASKSGVDFNSGASLGSRLETKRPSQRCGWKMERPEDSWHVQGHLQKNVQHEASSTDFQNPTRGRYPNPSFVIGRDPPGLFTSHGSQPGSTNYFYHTPQPPPLFPQTIPNHPGSVYSQPQSSPHHAAGSGPFQVFDRNYSTMARKVRRHRRPSTGDASAPRKADQLQAQEKDAPNPRSSTRDASAGRKADQPQEKDAPNSENRASSPSSEESNDSPRTKGKKDKVKVPPSKASGGVPNPTMQYLNQSRGPPVTTAYRKPLLVVLDLNGTILRRVDRGSGYVERKETKIFMSYCLSHFQVMVWSSATKGNVDRMCKKLLGKESSITIWSRDQLGLTREDSLKNVQCYKRLTRVWTNRAIQAQHPFAASGFFWDQTNTVLIDDSAEKARSEPYNCITLPDFNKDSDESLPVLPRVHDYLNMLACQEDVSCFIRAHPFDTHATQPLFPYTASVKMEGRKGPTLAEQEAAVAAADKTAAAAAAVATIDSSSDSDNPSFTGDSE